jgi:glycosyltransferase involved in cell wall biosynthesis
VVTPSFNQADYLELSIRSILLQGYPDLEYIIIDGGSTDQSVTIIRKYERWIASWVSEGDRGCSDASAKGLARTNAVLLAIMNADDYFALGAFATLLALRQAQPNNVLWGGAAPEIDSHGRQVAARAPFVHDHQALGNWEVGMWFFSPACLFDAATYRAAGGFDPRFYNIGDVELWIRMGKIGAFTFTTETVAFIHRDPQSVSRRDKLGNDIALISANYLNGNYDIARARMNRFLKRWLITLKSNQLPGSEPAVSMLAEVSPGILAQAWMRSLALAVRRKWRRIFPAARR